jgi:hypothetical protein
MNPHRQHYFDANRPRRPLQPEPRINPGALIGIGVIAAVAMVASLAQLIGVPTADDAVVTPVRSPVVLQYSLPSLTVEEARTEGFRAGVQSAQEQAACGAPLSSPIAAR